MNEFHHPKCSSQKQYVNALQLLYTAKQILHHTIINKLNKAHYTTKLEFLSSISDIIIHTQTLYWNAKQQYVHDIWDQTKSRHFTHNFSTLDTWLIVTQITWRPPVSYQILLSSAGLPWVHSLLSSTSQTIRWSIIRLTVTWPTWYHSWLPGLVKPFITSLRQCLSHTYI